MMRTLLVLPDGRQLFSGADGAAIVSATLTRTVNPAQDLTLGAVCPAMLECRLTDAAQVRLGVGDAVTLYRVDDAGQRYPQGIFLIQELTRSGVGMLELVAYDRLILLDRDLSDYINGLTGWPYSLQTLGEMVCRECGLTMAEGTLPNGTHPVQKLTVEGVTGRQMMEWIGEAAGSFCTADETGSVSFGFYTQLPGHMAVGKAVGLIYSPGTLHVTGDMETAWGAGVMTLSSPLMTAAEGGEHQVSLTVADGVVTHLCCPGSLQLSDYTVAPVRKVQLRKTAEDVGTVYPDTQEENAYVITGNPLLTAQNAQSLQSVAQTLLTRLQGVTYTPCKLKLQGAADIRPGQILQVVYHGQIYTCYVMTTVATAGYLEVECTGAACRGGTSAVNNQSFRDLTGKVLNLQADVDGLQVQNADAQGRMAQVELSVDKILTRVSQQEQTEKGVEKKLTELTQTSQQVSIAIQSVVEDGASKVVTRSGYTFSDDGLRISKSGQQMENRLDHEGMYVTRSGETMLRADAAGVLAADVSVRNYLMIGDYARIEDYAVGSDKKRTACFWIGG